MLEVKTVLRRILWEFCCECWKGEYAFIYLKCQNRIELKPYKKREERNEKCLFQPLLALRHGSYGDF